MNLISCHEEVIQTGCWSRKERKKREKQETGKKKKQEKRKKREKKKGKKKKEKERKKKIYKKKRKKGKISIFHITRYEVNLISYNEKIIFKLTRVSV